MPWASPRYLLWRSFATGKIRDGATGLISDSDNLKCFGYVTHTHKITSSDQNLSLLTAILFIINTIGGGANIMNDMRSMQAWSTCYITSPTFFSCLHVHVLTMKLITLALLSLLYAENTSGYIQVNTSNKQFIDAKGEALILLASQVYIADK